MDLDGKFSPPRLAFCTRRDPSGAEFVLLAGEDAPETGPLPRSPGDRTQYEAVLNHCHLFPGPLRPRQLAEARRAGLAAARSLRDSLARAFPGKRFAVFLTVSPEDVILRFHQLWPGEAPYYEVRGQVARDADGAHTDIYAFYTGGAE